MLIPRALRSIWMKLSTNNLKETNKHQSAPDQGSRVKLLPWCAGALVLFLLLAVGCQPRTNKVRINKLKNSRYQLIVDQKPYLIKGVCYSPIPIGKNTEYDWWSDTNKPWLVDGDLMQKMGINTIRLYQGHEDTNEVRRVIKDLYERYGIRTIMGNWLGFWEYPCPFYGSKAFQDRIRKEALDMVKEYKNEPGLLFWVLGNENNYSCLGRVNPWTNEEIDKEPDPQKKNALRGEIYYSFLNDLAKEMHRIDPNHPVAIGNGELAGLEWANKFCPDVDMVACIIYRGKTFGNLFKSLKLTFDRPVFIAEFGADAYDAHQKKEDQNMQAFFLESQWRQIYENLADNKDGAGNCLGGTIFEWNDEWWKHNESAPDTWAVHDTESNWSNPNYYFDIKADGNKNMNEEWFGIVALSEEQENGLNKRLPRKAYFVVREFWKNPSLKAKSPKRKVK